MSLLPVAGGLNTIQLGLNPFQIRLDYVLHFMVYFFICLYYILGRLNGVYIFRKKSLKKYILAVLFLALVTEIVQIWIPSRSFNIIDSVYNFLGLSLGYLCIKINKAKVRNV